MAVLTPQAVSIYRDDDHPDREWYARFLMRLRPGTVLKIGAGAMHEVKRLKELGGLQTIAYTSLDASEAFLEHGRKEFPEVTCLVGNVNKLKLPSSAYDIVADNSLLEHPPYYSRPVTEMLRVAAHLVVFNLFRWSLHQDIISRKKYFSNSYEITAFLKFVREHSWQMEHFLILRGEAMGTTRYADDRIIRTGDHLVVLAAKDDVYPLRVAYEVLRDHGIRYVANPYA